VTAEAVPSAARSGQFDQLKQLVSTTYNVTINPSDGTFECLGVSLSPCVTGSVVVFAVATFCFALDRALPATISQLVPNKEPDLHKKTRSGRIPAGFCTISYDTTA